MPSQSAKSSKPSKTATDALAQDSDAAMRKFEQQSRAVLIVPKAEVAAMLAKEKAATAKPKPKKRG